MHALFGERGEVAQLRRSEDRSAKTEEEEKIWSMIPIKTPRLYQVEYLM